MGLFDKAKEKAKEYTGSLKEQENANKELAAMPMEERVKMRPEGVKYCIVNSLGKILDVYENKVVFTSTKSTSTIITGLFLPTTASLWAAPSFAIQIRTNATTFTSTNFQRK